MLETLVEDGISENRKYRGEGTGKRQDICYLLYERGLEKRGNETKVGAKCYIIYPK